MHCVRATTPAWARNSVDDAFDKLCASHGELAAVTEGSWVDIAEYKPTHMDNYKALRKKKDAISNARMVAKLKKARIAELRAKWAAEKTALEAKEAVVRVQQAIKLMTEAVKAEAEKARERAEQTAIANAEAADTTIKEVEQALAQAKTK